MFNLPKVSEITNFFHLFKVGEMIYSESEPDFSNFAINSLSSKSESDYSESDFSSVFMNLDICAFLAYISILLNKLVDDFFYLFLKQNQ